MSNIQVTSKFVLLVLTLVALSVLLVVGTIEWGQGGPLITAIVFYGLGNGVQAAQGKPIASAIESKPSALPDA